MTEAAVVVVVGGVFIVVVVFVIVVISLTSRRTGRPVREAQRWLPTCHQQRPNTIPLFAVCRKHHICISLSNVISDENHTMQIGRKRKWKR